ncbi:MAG: hypothetical protein MI863_28950 [Desulfobacterales bacterium]|nr:hypothetical protein [Desulfobacterales bacterium]
MTKVFFTWLGPPQQATKDINGIPGKHRPDLFGILRTAKARFKNNPPPQFTLCVLKKFQAQFDRELPDYISTLAVDTSFDSSQYASLLMTKPDLNDLSMSVDYIMREIIKVRGTGYESKLLPGKNLAFVKDLWSFYSVWKYGGYHLDSGIFPWPNGATVNFPEPQGFEVPTIDSGDYRGEARHCKVTFSSGPKMCATLRSSESNFETLVMPDRISATNTSSNLKRLLDVWMMRSPAGDPSARRALEFYVRGWFEIRRWVKANPGEEGAVAELLRELVVFSAMTGVTHSGIRHQCSNKRDVDARIIQGANKVVKDMNLKKVGFRSHR